MFCNIYLRGVAMGMLQTDDMKIVEGKQSTVQIHPVKILKASVPVMELVMGVVLKFST
jgi:hypothetical protein